MEIRTLQYFLTIAREESISGAAEYLHVTQPTLSRQMKELEEELGKQLFIRGKRRITLTDEGMILRKRAEEILIYLGCGESEGMRPIAKTIATMLEKYPHVKFHLNSGKAEEVMEKIDAGVLDFGIVIEPVDLNKYDYLRLPYSNAWGILMKRDSTLASLDKITPDDLRGKPLLCSNQGMVKNELAGWIGGNQRKLNIVGTYNLLFNASLIVEEGNLYALCLDKIFNSNNSSLCFRPLEPKLEANMLIIWKKYQLFTILHKDKKRTKIVISLFTINYFFVSQ